MDPSQQQVATKRKTFWRMIKTMFGPAQAVARLMTGCGSGKRRSKLTLANMKSARASYAAGRPLNRPTLNRHSHSHPPMMNQNNGRISRHDFAHTDQITSGDQFNMTSTLPPPTVLPQNTNNLSDSDSDSCILAVGSLPQTQTNNSQYRPAPMTLEEAQVFLESLTLCGNSIHFPSNREDESCGRSSSTSCSSPGNVEQVVTVEIEHGEREVVVENDLTSQTQSPIPPISPSPNASSTINRDEVEAEIESLCAASDTATEAELRARRNRARLSMPHLGFHEDDSDEETIDESDLRMRRSRTSAILSVASSTRENGNDFHGWSGSSIQVSSNPPVTLAFIPSGLCIGDRIVWVKDEYPEIGTVRWIGKIRNQFYAGVEFDKPVGNSSGIYGYGVGLYKRLFTCKLPYGRFVPVKELVLYKDYHDTGVKSGIVCVICRDDFLDTWEPDSSFQLNNLDSTDDGTLQAFHMISTYCGHMYHWGCLDQWFSTKKRSDFHCPFCLRPMERMEIIRLFPSQL